MSSIKNYLFDVQEAESEKWIRERLTDENSDENSTEWLELEQEHSDYLEYLADQAEAEEELKWLKDNGTSILHKNFLSNLRELEEFVAGLSADESINMIYKMSYAHAVTLLESFLVDTLKSLVSEHDKLFNNAIANVDELKKARYSLKELANNKLCARSLAIMKLSGITYHNMPKAIKTYGDVLGTPFDIDINKVIEITKVRHDIVHRNGKTRTGENIHIKEIDLEQMFVSVKIFSEQLQQQINEKTA